MRVGGRPSENTAIRYGKGRSLLQADRQEPQQAIAFNLLRENIPLETIARITGLTIAQLQQLQAENR